MTSLLATLLTAAALDSAAIDTSHVAPPAPLRPRAARLRSHAPT